MYGPLCIVVSGVSCFIDCPNSWTFSIVSFQTVAVSSPQVKIANMVGPTAVANEQVDVVIVGGLSFRKGYFMLTILD